MKTETTALTVVQRAVVALGYNEENRKGLTALAGESKHITAITNADGREQAHAAMMKLKNTRIAIEKRGKEAREDATAFSKAVIGEEKALVGLISSEEERLQKLRDEWDSRIEAERRAKVEAEEKRQRELLERIAELRGNQLLTPMSGSKLISEHISDLEGILIDESFAEMRDQAISARVEGLARLRGLLKTALEQEQEAERLKAERAELDRQRAEQAERDRVAREAREAEVRAENERLAQERAKFEAEQTEAREKERQRQAAIDAENERIAAEQRARQAEIDKANRELEARQQAEREAQAQREREAAEAEERRLAAEREQAEKDRLAEEARARENFRPPFEEIVGVVAKHYNVGAEKVGQWIQPVKTARKAAA